MAFVIVLAFLACSYYVIKTFISPEPRYETVTIFSADTPTKEEWDNAKQKQEQLDSQEYSPDWYGP